MARKASSPPTCSSMHCKTDGGGNPAPWLAAHASASSSVRHSCMRTAPAMTWPKLSGGGPMPRTLGFSIAISVMQLRVSALRPPASAEIVATTNPTVLSIVRHWIGKSVGPPSRLDTGTSAIMLNASAPMASRTQACSSAENAETTSRTVVVSVISSSPNDIDIGSGVGVGSGVAVGVGGTGVLVGTGVGVGSASHAPANKRMPRIAPNAIVVDRTLTIPRDKTLPFTTNPNALNPV